MSKSEKINSSSDAGGAAASGGTAPADGGKNTIIMNILKGNKMGKILLFLFMFFFIFKIIDYIFIFFDVNRESGYTYFIWFMILFFWFVLLPLRASYLYSRKPDAGTEERGGGEVGPPVSATSDSLTGTGPPSATSGHVRKSEGSPVPVRESEVAEVAEAVEGESELEGGGGEKKSSGAEVIGSSDFERRGGDSTIIRRWDSGDENSIKTPSGEKSPLLVDFINE